MGLAQIGNLRCRGVAESYRRAERGHPCPHQREARRLFLTTLIVRAGPGCRPLFSLAQPFTAGLGSSHLAVKPH